MTLTIQLTPEQEARLAAAAEERGLAPTELVQELLTEQLPRLTPVARQRPQNMERDPALVARVRRVRGKYAGVGATTEDLHRERRAENVRDERQRGDAP